MKKNLLKKMIAVGVIGLLSQHTIAQETPVAKSTQYYDGILVTPYDSTTYQWNNPTVHKINNFLDYNTRGMPYNLSVSDLTPQARGYEFQDGDYKSVRYTWNDINGSYDEDSKVEITLDSEGRVIESLYLVEMNPNDWGVWYKNNYFYNAQGQLVESVYTSGSTPYSKTMYQYDGLGNLTMEIYQQWDDISSTYINSIRSVHDFTGSRFNKTEDYRWDGNNWQSKSYLKLFYEDDQLTAALEAYNYANFNEPEDWGKDSIKLSVNENNQFTELRVFYESNNDWLPGSRINLTYNSDGQLTSQIYRSYNNGYWEYGYRETFSYENGVVVNTKEEEFMNGSFEVYYEYNMEYNDLNQPIKIVRDNGPANNNDDHITIYNYYYEDLPLAINAVELKDIQLYPNPATDKITIDLGDKTIHEIELTDLNGRVVFSSQNTMNSSVVTLPIDHLTNGAYIVKVRSGNEIGVKNIIVSH